VNIFTAKPDFELPGVKMWSAAQNAGAELLGATYYELDADAKWADLHAHHANEELLVVLEGTPTVYTQEGGTELSPGDVVSFLRGLRGLHRLENHSAEPARFLMVSTMVMPDLVEYPERGRAFVMTEPPYTDAPYDPGRGRVLRVFDIDAGRPVPPDADA
jgi:uncharacterized cupin superfamily protein